MTYSLEALCGKISKRFDWKSLKFFGIIQLAFNAEGWLYLLFRYIHGMPNYWLFLYENVSGL